jgi:hypothetical protein
VAGEDVLTWQRGELDGAEVAGVAVVAPVADQVAAGQLPLDHVAERHRVPFGPLTWHKSADDILQRLAGDSTVS